MKRLLTAASLAFALLAGFVQPPARAGAESSGGAGVGPRSSLQQEVWRPIRREPFEVEVLVGGVPLEKYPARGRLYVEALRGEEYAIRVRNPLPVRVAVALSVDGLNTIDARRSAAWDASKWVIQPYGTITVSGWQVSRERARRFYFTDERDSYADKLGRPEDLGLITAVFFRERAGHSEITPRPRPRPLGTGRAEGGQGRERSARGSTQQSTPPAQAQSRAQSDSRAVEPADEDYAATGMGRDVGHDVRFVNLDLERRASAEVVIRYEYRPALVRLGILPRPHTAARDALRRRERARGFEDGRFSPEP